MKDGAKPKQVRDRNVRFRFLKSLDLLLLVMALEVSRMLDMLPLLDSMVNIEANLFPIVFFRTPWHFLKWTAKKYTTYFQQTFFTGNSGAPVNLSVHPACRVDDTRSLQQGRQKYPQNIVLAHVS